MNATDDQRVPPNGTEAFGRVRRARPSSASHIAARLGMQVRDEQQLVELMTRTAKLAVDEIHDVDHAGVTAGFGGAPFTVAPTSALVVEVDDSQYRTDDGPCLRAMRTDRRVFMTLAQVRNTWPQLADASQQAGVVEFMAAPLHVGNISVGSLNMYLEHTGHDLDARADVVTILTDYLDQGLDAYNDIRAREAAANALRHALHQRTIVDQAIGILMEQHNIDQHQAHRELDTLANQHACTRTDAAARLITGHTPPPPMPDTDH